MSFPLRVGGTDGDDRVGIDVGDEFEFPLDPN